MLFEWALQKEIEDWLMKCDEKDNPDLKASMYAVADLQLAFDNDEIMNMLTSRA